MKSLIEFINERGPAPMRFKFICSQTNKELPEEIIVDCTANTNSGIKRIFDNFLNNKYDKDIIVHFAKEVGTITYKVDMETFFKFEKTQDGLILVNTDDKRDIYDEKTLAQNTEINAIILI